MTLAALQLVAQAAGQRALGAMARRRTRAPRARWPALIESDYAARLVGIVRRTREIVARDEAVLLRGLRADEHGAARARRTIEAAREQAAAQANATALEGVAQDFGRRVAQHHLGELKRQTAAAIGVEPVLFDRGVPRSIETFVHENVSLIRSLQGRTLDDLEKLIVRAHGDGTRAQAVAVEIANRYNVAERHARLIARDQIGKLNSVITAQRHQELGLGSFEWVSMRDGRVRPRHVSLDGRRFRYDKLPAEGLPGTPVCCRCVQQPVFDDLLAQVTG